jgi:hypothetical protein
MPSAIQSRNQIPEDRKQMTENRGQKTEVRRQIDQLKITLLCAPFPKRSALSPFLPTRF